MRTRCAPEAERFVAEATGASRVQSPGVAQRLTVARLSGARNRTTCLPSELARLVERLSQP
jgi:hypothetical protein